MNDVTLVNIHVGFSVQPGATPLGPQEAPDGEVSTVWEGERPPIGAVSVEQPTYRVSSLANRGFNRSFHFTAKRLLPSAARGANRQ